MFEVTEEANRELKEFLTKQKSKLAIRILLQTG
jgi:Fe-S cluster assembly iron-binding protein IscA